MIGYLVVAALVGVFIGILSGMLGIGGGTVMVPLFRLAYGFQAIAATATSLFAIIPISVAGCITHIRNKTCVVKVGLAAGIAGACMSPVGVWLASVSPSWAIMLAAAAVITYSAYTMFKKALKAPTRAQRDASVEAQRASQKEAAEEVRPAEAQVASSQADGLRASEAKPAAPAVPDVDSGKLWMGVPIGLFAGLCSGYVGVGGGFIMVPLFVALMGLPMRYASGTSLCAIIAIAIPGTIEQLMLGNVDIALACAIAVGAIPGAVLGANLTKVIPERELRFIFAVVLVLSAVLLLVREFI